MWRILQNIQRGFRQVHHSQPLRTTNATQQNKKREDAESAELILSQIPEPTNGHVQVVRYHTRVHSGSSEQNGRHNEREDWESFKHHFNWSSCDQKTRMCEAMGWGSAIVVGLQLWHQLGRINWWSDDDEKQRFQHAIYRFAYAMPKYVGGKPTTRKSILAEGKNQQDAVKTKTPLEVLAEASNHFESLTTESTGSVLNIVGLSQAHNGSMVKAADQFRVASDLGYAKSLYNLGLCYEQGLGVVKCLKKAAEYYQLASDKGHPMALYNLAVFYLLGLGGLPKDTHKAVVLMEEAAEKGLQQAQVYMGIYYTEEPHQDMQRAVGFFEEGCKEGDAESQYYLGVCYEQGWGAEANEARAADLYSKAAKQGNGAAQYNLAVFHETGLGGLPVDREHARQLYKEASKAGIEMAMESLRQLDIEDRERLKKESSTLSQNKSEPILQQSTEWNPKPKEMEKQRSLHVSMSSPSLSSMVQQNDNNEQFSQPDWLKTGSLSVLDLIIPSFVKTLSTTPSNNNNDSVSDIHDKFDKREWLKEFSVFDNGAFHMDHQSYKGSFGVAVT